MSLRKSAISGVSWMFAQQISTQGLSFIVSIILARILVPAEFGLVAMITFFTSLATSFVEAGLGHSLIRTKYVGEKDFSTVFFFNVTVALLLYIILFFSAPFIAAFYEQTKLTEIIRVYSLMIVISAASSVHLTRLTKNMQFKTQLIIAIPSLVVSGSLGIVLALNGFGVWSLVYMGITQSLLWSMQLWVHSKWFPKIRYFSRKKLKHHFKFGINVTIVGIINTLYLNLYSLIIGKYFSPVTLGFYARANSLKDIFVNNISYSLAKVLYPTFAQIQDDDERLKSAYKRVMAHVFFIITPLLLFAMIFAEPMIRFLLTAKWLPMVPYFQLLCIVGILAPLQSYNGNILLIKGRSDLFLRLEYIKKGIFLIGIFVGLYFGIYGLLINQIIASITGLYINSYYSGRLIGYYPKEQLNDLLSVIIISLITTAATFIIYRELTANFEIPDIVSLVAGFITFFGLYFSMNHLFKTEVLVNIRSMIFKRKS